MELKIYHNPRCSKSRCALDRLKENSFDFEVVDYIKNSLSASEIKLILQQLKIKPNDLLRKNETEYKEHIQGKDLKEDKIIDLMVKYPKLIERPIVVWNGKAVIARPLEKLKELVNKN